VKNQANLKRSRFLENDRFFLTPRNMADMDDIYVLDRDDKVCYLDCRVPTEKSIEEYREDFAQTLSTETWLAYSIIAKDTGEFIGTGLIYHINRKSLRARWGILLAPKFWRQGIGTEVGQMLIKYAFEGLGMRKLCSGTHSGNIGSQKLQEKLGFVREGVLRQQFILCGEPHDDLLYGMLRKEWESLCQKSKGRSR
jgi:RimJ/RimL family protein N-acetyltransferase